MANAGTQLGESIAVKAVSAIPVIGPILGQIASSVLSFIGASHAAAVAKEAQTINQCLPQWINSVVGTMNALSMGEITEADAINALNVANATYVTCVHPVMTIDKACSSDTGACEIGGAPSNTFPQPKQSIGLGLTTSPVCCNTSKCNAACCILCSVVTPSTQGLIAIINEGGGTWVINPTQQNGAIAPTPAVTITYKKPSTLDVMDRDFLADLHLSSSVTGGSNVTGNIELAAIFGVAGIIVLFIIVLGHRSATA